MAHLYCNGGNRFNYVSIRNYTQNNFGGGYSYGCSMPSFGGIFSNWGTGIYNGCACNGGFNWSTFWGTGCGSLVGSFLGMLCGGGNTSGSTQGQRATGNNGNGKDTDFNKIDSVHKHINNPDNDVKNRLNKCKLDDCDKLILKQYFKGKLETLEALKKGLDGVNDTENKTYIDNLKNQLKQLATDKGIVLTDDAPAPDKTTPSQATDAVATQPTTGNGTDTITGSNENEKKETVSIPFEQKHNLSRTLDEPTGINWNTYEENEMIPSDLKLPEGFTAPKPEDIDDNDLIKVEEFKGKTIPINVGTCKVSVAGEKTKGFPEYLEITSSKTGSKWYYKYAGERGGYPVYITRDTDTNKNVYILCKQGNDYKLMQFDNFNGYGVPDRQNG